MGVVKGGWLGPGLFRVVLVLGNTLPQGAQFC